MFNLEYISHMPILYHLADLKSMVSAGLATLASSDFDLGDVVRGNKPMNILCIGHGGGSLPLFLANKIQGNSSFPFILVSVIFFSS